MNSKSWINLLIKCISFRVEYNLSRKSGYLCVFRDFKNIAKNNLFGCILNIAKGFCTVCIGKNAFIFIIEAQVQPT